MKKVLVLLVIGLLASVSVTAASPAGAKKRHPIAHALKLRRHIVRGIVQSVDSSSVTLKAKNGVTVTIALNAATKIRVNGKPATLDDVKVGYQARVRRARRGGPAKLLAAHEVPPTGTIAHGRVDSVGSSSITLKHKDGSTVTIDTNQDTKILVNGAAGSLGDIKAGYHARVKRTSASGPAAVIKAFAPGTRRMVLRGTVDSVGSNSITLNLKNGASVTVAVTAKTRIRVSGQAGALTDIQPGYQALVVRVRPGGRAFALRARPPTS